MPVRTMDSERMCHVNTLNGSNLVETSLRFLSENRTYRKSSHNECIICRLFRYGVQ